MYSHFFAPSVGGVETVVLSLARGLSELRSDAGTKEFEVTVVTQTPAKEFSDAALPYRIVRQPSIALLAKLIRGADVVHAAGPALAPLILGFLTRKPVVVEHHGYQAVCLNGILLHQPDRKICPGHFQAGGYSECMRCQASEISRLRSWINLSLMFPRNFIVRRAAANIAVTHYVEKRLALPRSSVVYHGIEEPLARAATQPSAGKAAGRICFACVGRLVREKGLPVLLEAAGQLREAGYDFELLLIGDGPERPQLEAHIARERLGDFVRVTGYLTGEAFAAVLENVRVVVMPSIWEETAGLAAIEQMMRGKLVIASEIGGLGEVVGEAALRFPAGEAAALAGCMRKVLQDPALIDTLGLRARQRAVALFSRGRMLEGHAGIYKEALRKTKG